MTDAETPSGNTTVAVLLFLATLALPLADTAPVVTPLAETLVQAQDLVQRILDSLATIHTQAVTLPELTLDSSGHDLDLLRLQLQIPTPPVLKPLALPTFTQGDLLRRIWEGLEQQQRIVGDLSSKVTALSGLSIDLHDLQAQVTMMLSSVGVAVSAQVQSESSILSGIHGDYNLQVATHLTLTTLRDFCRDLHRSLRSLSSNHSATSSR